MAFSRRRFDTLDALRFFAFLRVFFYHVPLPGFPLYSEFIRGGDNGVFFFFVLSSFLISWLLFQERGESGKISLGRFYLRRTLRIWPLYYLAAALAFSTPFLISIFNLPSHSDGYAPDWHFSLFFLGNYESMLKHGIPNVSPLGPMWSLCVEEHFYLIWGLCFIFMPLRFMPRFFAATVFIGPAARILYHRYDLWFMDLPTNIDFFGYGGLSAWLLSRKKEWVEEKVARIPGWAVQGSVVLLVAIIFAESRLLDHGLGEIVRPSVLAPVFAAFLLLCTVSRPRVRIGETSILSKLGVISYGLYLFHTVVINGLNSILQSAALPMTAIPGAVAFAAACFTGTVLVSALSYRFIERPFLKLKALFSKHPVAEATPLLAGKEK
jgi:peptidoglycan/LPS O-acetylase OafA/YrhL